MTIDAATNLPASLPETINVPSQAIAVASGDPDKNAVFAILQKYNRVNLLMPIGAPHMWNAAMDSKTVKLTALGEHYRRLVAKGLK